MAHAFYIVVAPLGTHDSTNIPKISDLNISKLFCTFEKRQTKSNFKMTAAEMRMF
jgi:hypothetical protein